MKTKKYILYALSFLTLIGSSCSDTWDNHYAQEQSAVNNDQITIVNKPLTEYLAEESSLTNMYQLFKETGMIDEMQKKGQMYTILATEADLAPTRAASNDDVYTAQTYISDASISPSKITDGQRLLMWSGKFLNIKKTEEETGNIIQFNNATVTKIVKLTNGYLYILDQAIVSPRSMYEIIESLGDDYSIFRQMILSRNQLTFDKNASEIIGVDNTGNTVYDSVFTVKAPYFENKGFDIMSENVTATMLIPSNEVINDALTTARQKLTEWGLEREDSIIRNWVFQAAFFNKKYTKLDFEENEDLKSVFSKQWRTTVQEVDLDHPVNMSNGTAYYVKKMKIPTNVLIYRLKDHFYYYEKMTALEKETYFKTTNLAYKEIGHSDGKSYHDGWPAMGFPRIYYYTLVYDLADPANKTYTLEFTPFKYKEMGTTEHEVSPYKIPEGTYKIYFGFEQDKSGKVGQVKIFVNDVEVGTASESANKGTNFHFDRNGGGYAEGYDANAAKAAGVSKYSNYDRDGGVMSNELVVTGEAKPITIRFEGSGNSLTKAIFFHWCLKPTEDCY